LNTSFKLIETKEGGHFTRELEGPRPLDFKISHGWKTLRLSHFTFVLELEGLLRIKFGWINEQTYMESYMACDASYHFHDRGGGFNNKWKTMIPHSRNFTTLDLSLLIVLTGAHKRSWIVMNLHLVESWLFKSLSYIWRPVLTQNLIFCGTTLR
jgi:hypothetical protein